MSSTQVNAFIDTDTQVEAMRSGTGTVYVNIDSLTLFLATPEHTKAGALAVLARLTAAVEALPDDPEPLPWMSFTCPTCAATERRVVPQLCSNPWHALDDDEITFPDPDPAPVWRTLTFGDLRAGDVIKSDQDDDPETVERVLAYVRTDQSTHYRNADLVLVRHPRPEVGQ